MTKTIPFPAKRGPLCHFTSIFIVSIVPTQVFVLGFVRRPPRAGGGVERWVCPVTPPPAHLETFKNAQDFFRTTVSQSPRPWAIGFWPEFSRGHKRSWSFRRGGGIFRTVIFVTFWNKFLEYFNIPDIQYLEQLDVLRKKSRKYSRY